MTSPTVKLPLTELHRGVKVGEMASKRFIVIAGNIGSGKTTLTRLLASHYEWEPHFESVTENPYLGDFYGDMRRWSFPCQIFFLAKRFQAHQRILQSNTSAIQDRSIYEDAHIFARALYESGAMDERDYATYQEMYNNMAEALTPPDLIVHVRRSVGKLKERISERGRGYEENISIGYLEQLNRCYDEWIENYRFGKVLNVQADRLDWRDNPRDLAYIHEAIESSLDQPDLFFHA